MDIHERNEDSMNLSDRTGACTIRMAMEDDAQKLLDIYAPYVEHSAITFEYEIPSLEEFKGRMRRVQERYPYIVAEVDGEIAGYAYASAFHVRAAYDWCAEMSVYLKETEKRNGYGKRLYQVLEKILKLQNILNVNACIAYAPEEDEYLSNHSMRFHEHMGYRLVGRFHQCGYKFERWYDMIWMEKMLGEHTVPAESVIPVTQLELTADFLNSR